MLTSNSAVRYNITGPEAVTIHQPEGSAGEWFFCVRRGLARIVIAYPGGAESARLFGQGVIAQWREQCVTVRVEAEPEAELMVVFFEEASVKGYLTELS